MKTVLQGLVAAPFTAFQPDGALALDAIPRQAALLHRNGVNGAFICGTTGEGASLSTEERRIVAETWRKHCPAGLELIVHVGHLSATEAAGLARHAQKIGADRIATIAPSFFKPARAEELVAWCAEVAAGAPDLPFYYYHMPSMTGVNIKATDFLQHAAGRIPNLAGIKFTYEDLEDYRNACNFDGGRFTILFGRDEILLSGLRMGATGAVGSTYNYAAPLYVDVIKAFKAGDSATAEAKQAQARQFIDVMNGRGGLPFGKAIMRLIGVDCGGVRLPLRKVTDKEVEELRAALDAVGFFGYCSKL